MSIVGHAKKEFEVLGWPGKCEMQKAVCDNVIELLEAFAKQGHSGSSAPYVMGLFKKLGMHEPISPLTGEDDEWVDISIESGEPSYQNKRCSEVFKKGKDGKPYWINGKIFCDEEGCTYTSGDSFVDIEFPWTRPEPEIVHVINSED